jgi:hypothetical protein
VLWQPADTGIRGAIPNFKWEIHPVYAIDVCKKKSLNNCKANNDSVWTPLDQWQGDE